MPFDGHSYLVAQGWKGHGNGLRNGDISRPLAIPQKRTLAGLGKDRDEAFPFWDHVFSAAASAIKIKIHADSDDEGSDSSDDDGVKPELKRTSTGILSNRRPLLGTPASSGVTTPSTDENASIAVTRTASIVSIAKREAARKALYARLFRGQTLETELSKVVEVEQVASTSEVTLDDAVCPLLKISEELETEKKRKKRKEKRGEAAEADGSETNLEAPKEKKRRSKVKGEKKKVDDNAYAVVNIEEKEKRRRRKEKKRREKLQPADEGTDVVDANKAPSSDTVDEKSERKQRRKLEKLALAAKTIGDMDSLTKNKKRKAQELERPEGISISNTHDQLNGGEGKKRKKEKKRRQEEDSEEGNAQ